MGTIQRYYESKESSDAKSNESVEKSVINNKNYTLDEKIKNRYSWLIVVSVIIVVITGVFITIYNVIIGENFGIDVATVLSTLLAFFSIFLSSIFYFKATEQSNDFYDRSYTHTRDIAKTLSKMDGSFSEALRNIEGYSNRLNERFDNLPGINSNLQNNVLKEMETMMEEMKKVIVQGNISPEDIIKYEERLSQIQKENKELKVRLDNNKYIMKNSDLNYFLIDILRRHNISDLKKMSSLEIKELFLREADFLYDGNNLINELIYNDVIKPIKDGIIITDKGMDLLTTLKLLI
ncbi:MULTISPECIES: hypothetical protein [Lysinibacillus]|uniref:Uncharacterized protein n=2 Tax=Lysinibacillus TaxID=400634 RepID=A0ABY2T9C0_9BACI|nr:MULTISPECIES: hypothetical protein [Lysinibacillus]AHN24258.1 hypothetical protein T479_12555 [Lysinibacillus varians]TKI50639.1 hypothetical protein FC748_05360 [Lysinibacillus tabacifolii]TKI52609.1 hypothetical protein FC752_18655 [Lysinibacillus varians]